jgi:hypothetical protein
MPRYRIKPGHSYRLDDGSVATAGEVIELAADVAAQHPASVDLVPDEIDLPVIEQSPAD